MSFPPKVAELGPMAGLEDRLRGMIINNGAPPGSPDTNPSFGIPGQPHFVPTYLDGALESDKEEFLARQTASQPDIDPGAELATTPPGRKRLNQAQRRQMNAQLSIPVDSRPVAQGRYVGRGLSSSRGFHRDSRHNGSQNVHEYDYKQVSHQSKITGPQTLQGHPSPPCQMSPGLNQYQNSPQIRGGFHHNPRHSASGWSRVGSGQGYQLGYQPPQQQNFPPQGQFGQRPPTQSRQLFQPTTFNNNARSHTFASSEQLAAQCKLLDDLTSNHVPIAGVDDVSISEMETFRAKVEEACRDAISQYEMSELHNDNFDPSTVELRCFGSMASGFAIKSSDMDLALLSPNSDPSPDSGASQIPRLLEKKLLEMGIGARLLTRTRVPIIKLCQRPTKKLLQDLRDNHEKWEAGKGADEDDDDLNDDDGTAAEATVMDNENTVPSESTTNSTVIVVPKKVRQHSMTIDEHFATFKQKDNETLGDYYSRAKKLLHKVGGKDVHTAHAGGLSVGEIQILSALCQHFIDGLLDTKLKARLLLYQSLNPGHGNETLPHRSLSGVYSQVEGERLTMGYESRPLNLTESSETNTLRQIENWQRLCDRTDLEPLSFNRYLFQNVEQLRKIAVLQLAILEQNPSEDPGSYLFRTIRIAAELRFSNTVTTMDIDPAVVSSYAAGVYSPQIRSHLAEVISRTPDVNLAVIARIHHILSLIEGYKAGCQSGKYTGEGEILAKRYIGMVEGIVTERELVFKSPHIHKIISQLCQYPNPLVNPKSRPRDRYNDALEFPKDDIGIQCDINFSAQLALHNTLLLRCYSLTDPRVRPLILFVKHWAKTRAINTPYRGTLSSYGYVLMVLHYLVNVATPFVCPNLQQLRREPQDWLSPAEKEAQTTCLGKDVRFWRNEKEILNLAQRGMLNHNKHGLGVLLRGFFEYFAQNGPMSSGDGRGFDWGREVLSLRTHRGILTKQYKGWVGARTDTVTLGDVKADPKAATPSEHTGRTTTTNAPNTITFDPDVPQTSVTPAKKKTTKEETKEIRHRYLFAIEDPFELDHNVARTVTHLGIVSIRDEFRRAWRIIKETGKPNSRTAEGLLDAAVPTEWSPKSLKEVFEDLHGPFDTALE